MHEAALGWRAGTTGDVRIEPGHIELPPAAREELARDLASLGKVDPGWPDAALTFVLEGTGISALEAIAMRREAGQAYVLQDTRGVVGGYECPRHAWLRSVREADPRLLLRMGVLWAAICEPWRPYRKSPHLPLWIDALIDEVPTRDWDPGYDANAPCFDALLMEKVLSAGGEAADLLTREYVEAPYSSVGDDLPDLAQALVRHRHYVDRAFETADGKLLERLLDRLCEAKSDGTAWLEPIARAAISGHKRSRQHARDLVLRGRAAYVPVLSQFLAEGDAAKRLLVIEVLGTIGGEAVLEVLRAALAGERTARVRSSIEAVCRAVDHAASQAEAPAFDLLPPYDPQPSAPLPAEARVLFERMCDEWHTRALVKKSDAQAISPEVREMCWTLLCSAEPWEEDARWLLTGNSQPSYLFEECVQARELFEHSSFTPTHLVRLADMMHGYWSAIEADRRLRAHRKRCGTAYDLRTVAAAYSRSGKPDDYVQSNHSSYEPTFHWEANAVWPYFAERLEHLDAALGLAEGERNEAWGCALLATFPTLPPRYHGVLWSFALGTKEPIRTSARKCLRSTPGLVARLIEMLSDSAHEARASAATWLGELGDASAIDPLRERVRKETHDLTKARQLEALEALGVAPETLIDRDELVREAKRLLAKGTPSQLLWLPLAALPEVSWEEGGKLPPVLLKAWIVQAFKQKQSASNGSWKALAQQLERWSRERFAAWLLAAWLGHDMRAGKGKRAKPVDDKGLLALVGGFGGSDVEAPIAAYLAEHYGWRMAECFYLLDVLAWVDLPLTTQRLVRVARAFRTPSIQAHAAKLVKELAERKGWTKQTLADRTVSDLGLDERASAQLEYRSVRGAKPTRRFTLRLDPALTLRIEDDAGKTLKSLPKPNKTESAEHAQALAKQLQALRKELKATVTMQTGRLFDAMCEQRPWPVSDWQECIQRHPVMRALGERLVWTVGRDQVRTAFRILGDGSLTSVDDGEVPLEPHELVRLAHREVLDAASCAAWVAHLADYKIEPLFSQLGRPCFAPDDAQLDQTALLAVDRAAVNGLALSRLATKLGWQRGPLGDGARFESYLRRFPGLGLVAELSISDCSPYALDQPIELGALSFYGPGGTASAGRLSLRNVPKVLRTECVNDVRDMSALGTAAAPSRKRAG